ncbi:MAG: DNA adenine methylase [Roseofilum sp. SBFL]|uniref:DNA adenine methylase n=1 Tax=unclassified Roseofilum TaxID=2620099 RepID=UPI001B08FF32|nr:MULTISPECIES: DNA adenine methylase [unclassified Roseofilum]MBP0012615.1 DNA adenine methylase [Roseofilum sp. SID3]MBP0025208.1 DNA adenine methylase [Roseofilum sp. SID2]MBP0039822.1 DNA adenine methylase [Roseofilum sp. SID1]MBP0044395.1 DNA adenine methylase [Roseofilum sp. SBFL]
MERRAVEKPLDPQRRKGDKYNLLVQPFLKWAGGKRQLMPVIKKYIPQKYTQYYEPFVGAGAVLFSLQPEKTVINDTNKELMNCYNVIKEHPDELLDLCQEHERNNSKDYYYTLRSQDRHSTFKKLSSVKRAARLIYLNKTCFNGLFRVNSKGQFNVPYGNPINPVIADRSIIKAVSNFLNQRSVRICEGDFEDSVSTARQGDFVYFDPPYHPISDTSSFTGYSVDGFGQREQERVKQVCDRLSDLGCNVLVSNSNAPLIRELYSDSRYEIVEVNALRAINAVSSKRGKIQELLIYNKYECKTIDK